MNIDEHIDNLKAGKCIKERYTFQQIIFKRYLQMLCEKVKEIFIEESNLQPVCAPVTVCGNIYGQFYDLLELFRIGGEIPKTNYIFLGGFVSRGYNSVETFELLLCLKIKYPANITLIRGNHETKYMTEIYGFYDEIYRKYGNYNPWKYFTSVFQYLPIAALIEGQVLCLHGGLSPDIKIIDQIRAIDRNIEEIPMEGPLHDLIYSNPIDYTDTWEFNFRSSDWYFGAKIVSEFNYLNNLRIICRAHDLIQEGYNFYFAPEKSLVTIWSAPNYCQRHGNVAAMMNFNENLDYDFNIFKQVPESAKIINLKNIIPYFF